jgi:4-hydroxy-3-polyprenylbenzoate decarboxylase
VSDLVLAITGASGALYAVRLLEVLAAGGRRIHLLISPSGAEVFRTELGRSLDLEQFDEGQLGVTEGAAPSIVYHHHQDYSAPIASGSFRTDGMVICPCSMGTLGSIANGLSTNLIQRAADVHLKERRRLIVVPRETPLSRIAIDNMRRLSDAGGIILPAMPGFYHRPQSIADLVDFVVARICDQLNVEMPHARRWGDATG